MITGLKVPQLTDPKTRSLLASAPKRRLLKSTNTFKYEEGDGFIRLPSRRGQQDAQDYRSITKRPTDSDSNSSDSDSDQPSTDDDSDSMQLTSYQEMTKSLDQKLTANPSSISTWLSMLSHSLSTVPLTSKNAVKARSEITVSLMSRALSAHPDNTSSKIIRLKYLMAGEEIWHESKLRAEWENALKIGGAEIWMEWLEWRMRTKNRGINGMVEDAVRVLQSIGQDELGKVRVLWRLAVAFQAAGVYCWQCLPEFLNVILEPRLFRASYCFVSSPDRVVRFPVDFHQYLTNSSFDPGSSIYHQHCPIHPGNLN
jgi:NRDE-2, necessary for RNA interference